MYLFNFNSVFLDFGNKLVPSYTLIHIIHCNQIQRDEIIGLEEARAFDTLVSWAY